MTHHKIRDVYRTEPATATVTIKPGTRPSTEYEYGKDMIARQMYSAKSSAAVCEDSSETALSLSPDIDGGKSGPLIARL